MEQPENYGSRWEKNDMVFVDPYFYGNAIIEIVTSKDTKVINDEDEPLFVSYEVYYDTIEDENGVVKSKTFSTLRDAKLAAEKPQHSDFTSEWEQNRSVFIEYACHKGAIIETITSKILVKETRKPYFCYL